MKRIPIKSKRSFIRRCLPEEAYISWWPVAIRPNFREKISISKPFRTEQHEHRHLVRDSEMKELLKFKFWFISYSFLIFPIGLLDFYLFVIIFVSSWSGFEIIVSSNDALNSRIPRRVLFCFTSLSKRQYVTF